MKNLSFQDIDSAKRALNSGKITQNEYNNWLENFNYYSIQSMEDELMSSKNNFDKRINELKNQSSENHLSLISEIKNTNSELIKNEDKFINILNENNALKEEIKQNQINRDRLRIEESRMPKIREIGNLINDLSGIKGGIGALNGIKNEINEYFNKIINSTNNQNIIEEIKIIYDRFKWIVNKEKNEFDLNYFNLTNNLFLKKQEINLVKMKLDLLNNKLDDEILKIKWREVDFLAKEKEISKLNISIKAGYKNIDVGLPNPSNLNLFIKKHFFLTIFLILLLILSAKVWIFIIIVILFLIYGIFIKNKQKNLFKEITNKSNDLNNDKIKLLDDIKSSKQKTDLEIIEVRKKYPEIEILNNSIEELNNNYYELINNFKKTFKDTIEIRDRIGNLIT